MATKSKVKIAIDILLAFDLIAIMATALVEEAPHEYLGLVLFVLMAAHIVLNRRWFAALTRGRWTPRRALQTVAIAGLAACLLGQVASAIVLSKHALWFLPAISGTSWARTIHMMCSHWAFVFAFAHVGLQLKGVLSRMGVMRSMNAPALWAARAIWLAVAVVGVWSFVQLGLADYLFARVQFAAIQYEVPFVVRFAQYAVIAALIAGVFHYLGILLDKLHRVSQA